jgi:hypothetical protein
MEYWKTGVMEYWSGGVLVATLAAHVLYPHYSILPVFVFLLPITPFLQYSITPILEFHHDS